MRTWINHFALNLGSALRCLWFAVVPPQWTRPHRRGPGLPAPEQPTLRVLGGAHRRMRWRGHNIRFVGDSTYFCDTGLPTVSTWRERGCGHCRRPDTSEGHDACLGTLPHPVMNACCGHGVVAEAYVQFFDRSDLRGQEAIDWFAARSMPTFVEGHTPGG